MKGFKLAAFIVLASVILIALTLLALVLFNRTEYSATLVFDMKVVRAKPGGKGAVAPGDECELHLKKVKDSEVFHTWIYCHGERYLFEDDTSLNIWEDNAEGVNYYRVTGRDGVGHSDHVRRGFTFDSHRNRMFLHPVYSRLGDISDPEGAWYVEWEMPVCSRPRRGGALFPENYVPLTGCYHLGNPRDEFMYESPPEGVKCADSAVIPKEDD